MVSSFNSFHRGSSKQNNASCSLADLPLSRYLLSSMLQSFGTGHRSKQLYPCPPPYPWHQKYAGGSRRNATRFHRRRACEFMVNYLCCSLSHVALGYTCVAPPGGKCGVPLSLMQQDLIGVLWRRVKSMCRLLRPGNKCGASLERLLGNLGDLEAEFGALDLIPYSRLRAKPQMQGGVLEHGPQPRGVPTGRPGPLVVDRVDFPDTLRDFQAQPFLSHRSYLCLVSPDQTRMTSRSRCRQVVWPRQRSCSSWLHDGIESTGLYFLKRTR